MSNSGRCQMPTTTIVYNFPSPSNNLKISIYDINGRLVKKLYQGSQSMGQHKVIWNAENLSSGVYFLKLKADNKILTKKLILIK